MSEPVAVITMLYADLTHIYSYNVLIILSSNSIQRVPAPMQEYLSFPPRTIQRLLPFAWYAEDVSPSSTQRLLPPFCVSCRRRFPSSIQSTPLYSENPKINGPVLRC